MRRRFQAPPAPSLLPPGMLSDAAGQASEKAQITVIDYDEAHFDQHEVAAVEECFSFRDSPTVTWINVDGIRDAEVTTALGSHFGLHPLVLEDITTTGQRPKIEDYDGYLYLVVEMLTYSEEHGQTQSEQVSLVLGKNFVISFQERPGDIFDPIRERLRTAKGRIRKMGPDYLIYCLLDAVIDGYFTVLEKLGERVEAVEDQIVSYAQPAAVHEIHALKSEQIFLRKAVWPLREAIGSLQRAESPLIAKSTAVYLRDVYDHTIQVMDTIESSRDIVSGLMDIYLSSAGNRMNEVMKVLTVIATIFIPLTFIAGLYGMNFQYMPELSWRWGYPAVLAVMAAVVGTMLMYFRRRRWI